MLKMRLYYWGLLLACVIGLREVRAQATFVGTKGDKPETDMARFQWADSVYQSMNEVERIAQLFMVAAYSNKDAAHEKAIEGLIKEYKIGGLIFFQGNPYKQAQLTNRYQGLSKTPMLIAIDGEWGLGMRLDSTISYPRQLTLGAISNERLIQNMGREIARQCRRMGIHVNFAPVIDVNNNPDNPVINDRSFGEDKMNVALKGMAYMQGLQDGGVIACAKHFPGHGDTDQDSHLTLPVVNHKRERLEDLEFYPFKILIKNGIQSIMVAHMHVPALDSTPQLATSLSHKVVTGILKEELGFKGLVFSDALNMKGVSSYYQPGEVDLMAFEAGNDVLLFAENVPRAIQMFQRALNDGRIKWSDIERSVKKILLAKYEVGLNNYKAIELNGLTRDLNSPAAQYIKQQLYEEAMTLVANDEGLVPVLLNENSRLASVSIGRTSQTAFQDILSGYSRIDHYQIGKSAESAEFRKLIRNLKDYSTVVVGIHDMSKFSSKNFGVSEQSIAFLRELSQETKVIITVFGSPYSLKYFEGFSNILLAYQEDEVSQKVAAEVLFGAVRPKGRLPVSASLKFRYGTGLTSSEPPLRLQYTWPEAVGISSNDLAKIDTLVQKAIADKATPGCQVLVAMNGKVIYQKSFGYKTYDQSEPVTNTDLYDLASITKVAATTISLMRLYDERRFLLNRRLSDYLPDMPDTAAVKNLLVRDVLTHQSGLTGWIPFYLSTTVDSIYDKVYSNKKTGKYSVQVAKDLYMNEVYKDSIFRVIYNAEVSEKPEYKYSDLGFYMFRKVIENIAEEPFSDYVEKNFYQPLGLATMTFNPLDKFPETRIVPTENDKLFRKQLVRGYVHDPGAAMLGGVSGHAGLFSNANDLAVLMQMLLNKGEYGGVRFLEPNTVTQFTRRNNDRCRRGLGFDKPETDIYKPGPTAKSASPRTFGHSGFTGTGAWADPDYELIYIFLSNRVYPDIDNNKLITNNVRTDIQETVYKAIQKNAIPRIKAAEN